MAFKIFTKDEPLKVNGIVVVIYGIPGIGKTSLAFTAEKPILEDYEDGVKRCINRGDYLKVDKWEDAVEFHNSTDFTTLAPKTLVIDTAGFMLDNYIAQYVIRQDIKNARGGGELSLQGYGAIKNVFKQFVSAMKSKGIDLIFVCHSEKEKEGDDIKFIPKMTGGSYDILLSEADMVGFYESKNNKRVLQFAPTDRNVGKNTAEFDLISVPHYTDALYNKFLAGLITQTKNKMMEFSEEQRKALLVIDKYKKKIEESDSTEKIEVLFPEFEKMNAGFKAQLFALADKKYQSFLVERISVVERPEDADEVLKMVPSWPVRYQGTLKQLLWDHCITKGLAYDKPNSKFIIAPTEEKIPAAPAAEKPKSKKQPVKRAEREAVAV